MYANKKFMKQCQKFHAFVIINLFETKLLQRTKVNGLLICFN